MLQLRDVRVNVLHCNGVKAVRARGSGRQTRVTCRLQLQNVRIRGPHCSEALRHCSH